MTTDNMMERWELTRAAATLAWQRQDADEYNRLTTIADRLWEDYVRHVNSDFLVSIMLDRIELEKSWEKSSPSS